VFVLSRGHSSLPHLIFIFVEVAADFEQVEGKVDKQVLKSGYHGAVRNTDKVARCEEKRAAKAA